MFSPRRLHRSMNLSATHQRRKENTSPRSRTPVSIQNGVVQIPDVPVTFAQEAGARARRRAAEKHDKNLADQNARGLGPSCLRRPRGISSHVGLVDEDRAKRGHDRVDGLDHRPHQRGALERRAAKVEAADAAAVLLDGPAHDPEQRGARRNGLDDEQVPEDGRVDEHDGKLQDPEDEEGEQVGAGDARARRQGVWDPVPRGPENGAQGHRGHPAAVVRLGGEIDDGHRCAHQDEELRAAHASCGADVHGEADVVASRAAGVEDHDNAED